MTIANFITGVAIGFGWIAVILLIDSQVYLSVIFALLAFLIDCLDGFVARKLRQESDIGRQMDGFSDALLFLVWPGLFYYLVFGLRDAVSVLIQAVFIAAGIFRLSRFNSVGFIRLPRSRVGYPGLPVVFSFLVIWILLYLNKDTGSFWFSLIADLLIVLHSVLMVMKFPFPKPGSKSVIILIVTVLVAFLIYGKSIV